MIVGEASRSATAASARCGRSRSASPRTASCSSPGRTARARRRCCGSSPGSPSPTKARSPSTPSAATSAIVGHEPLLYRELTALENLELFGRLYRVPERRERSGMLLERFGLWDARAERVSTFSRGMTQRLALCRALLHDPALARARRAVHRPRRGRVRRCSTASSQASPASATIVLSTHDPARVARARDRAGWRWRERPRALRVRRRRARAQGPAGSSCARGTPCPAMLLFVLSTLAVFHFALPAGQRRRRGLRPALDRDRLHRAARPRAGLGAGARRRGARRARARAL